MEAITYSIALQFALPAQRRQPVIMLSLQDFNTLEETAYLMQSLMHLSNIFLASGPVDGMRSFNGSMPIPLLTFSDEPGVFFKNLTLFYNIGSACWIFFIHL